MIRTRVTLSAALLLAGAASLSALAAEIPINIHVIGFDVTGDTEQQLREMAAAGRGRYYSADNEAQLTAALAGAAGVTIHETVDAEREPNNTFGTANHVASSGGVRGTIQPARDVDVYLLEVDRQGMVEVRFSGISLELDVQLAVHNANNTYVTILRPFVKDGASKFQGIDLPYPGKFYFYVSDDGGDFDSDEPYHLQFDYYPADDYEPNSTVGTAVLLRPPQSVETSILPLKDEDWFRFRADRPGVVEVRMTGVADRINPGFDVRNQENSHYAGWFDPPVEDAATEPVLVDLGHAGTYYLRLADTGGDARAKQPFKLHVALELADENEPNGSFGLATAINSTHRLEATILPTGDVDCYRAQVDRAGSWTVELSGIAPNLDLSLTLRDENGNHMLAVTPRVTSGTAAKVVFDLPRPGGYFLLVSDKGGDSRASQPYALAVRFDAADAYEPNGSLGGAADVEPHQTVKASILPAGERDWYAVELPGPGALHVRFTHVPDVLHPTFEMQDAERRHRGSWTPRIRQGQTQEIAVRIDAAGRYYLNVGDARGARSAEPYELRLRFEAADKAE